MTQSLSSRTQAAFVGLIFAIGVFGYLMNTSGWFTMIPGDLGDARFNSVILEHLYQWVTGSVAKLWSPRFFFPFEYTLAFSDNHFGSGWSYVMLRVFGLPREEAYLGWFLIGASLNFWVCWVVLKRLGFSAVGAAAGAFVFAFALPALHKENHAQLVYRFAVPLAAAAWYRAMNQRNVAYAVQTVFWCAVQFLCSIYVGVFLLYLLLAMLLAQAIFGLRSTAGNPVPSAVAEPVSHTKLPKAFDARGVASSAWWLSALSWVRSVSGLVWCGLMVVGVVLTGFTLKRYQHVSLDYNFVRPLSELVSMLPRPGSYLLADHSTLVGWLGRMVTDVPMRHEQQMFVGFGVAALALMGLFWSWRTLAPSQTGFVRRMLLALLLLVGFTLMVGDNSFYLLMAKVPGVSSIRAVSRIALILLFPLAVAVAAGFDGVVRAAAVNWLKGLGVLTLIGVLTLESICYNPHHTPMQSWRARRDALQAKIGTLPKDSVLFVTQPSAEPFFMTEIDAMIYAQDHHLATLNGYSGNTPPRYTYPDPCLPPEMRVDSYFALRGLVADRRQKILNNLHTVFLEPCSKPTEPKPQ